MKRKTQRSEVQLENAESTQLLELLEHAPAPHSRLWFCESANKRELNDSIGVVDDDVGGCRC